MIKNSIYKLKKSKLARASSWMVASSGISSLMRFFLILIIISFYQKEEFGLWASITSIAAVLITGDFGITNVLRNLISKEQKNGITGDIISRRYFYSAEIVFVVFSVLGSILLLLLSDYIPYDSLFKTDNILLKEQGRVICIYVQIIFLVNLPMGLGLPLFFSYGETKFYSLFTALQSAITFLVVLGLAVFSIPIHIVAVVYFAVNTIVNFSGTLVFIHKRRWYKIDVSIISAFRNFSVMLPSGIKFLLIQITSSFVSNVLTIYSGALLSLEMAANVNLAQKIFLFFSGIYKSIFNPIWSHLSSLYFKHDLLQCRIVLKKSIIMTTSSMIILLISVVLFRNLLVNIIANSEYETSWMLFTLVGLFVVSKAIFDNISLLHNATNRINVILSGYLVFSAFVLWVVPHIAENLGFYTLIVSLVICWVLFCIVVFWHLKYKLLSE